ncbi:MAG: hypothetical protein LUE20_04845 [Oscillospiraceae bacterium]|nr:hypothetical protein [Oscillospiraceae bacterium]
MKATKTEANSLDKVREHQRTWWKLGTHYDVDFREFLMVAEDLRTLEGKAGYAEAEEANKLCQELLPVAAHKLDVLGAHIGLWQKNICEKYGEEVLEKLKESMVEKHSVGCPTMKDTREASRKLKSCSECYEKELLIGEAFEDKSFAVRLAKVMSCSAYVIELSVEWVSILIRFVCAQKEGGLYEAV